MYSKPTLIKLGSFERLTLARRFGPLKDFRPKGRRRYGD